MSIYIQVRPRLDVQPASPSFHLLGVKMAFLRINAVLLLAVPFHVAAFVGRTSLSALSRYPACSMKMVAKPLQLPSGDSMEIFKETVLQCELPVLVDFHAAWCAPCKMVAPVMEEMAKDFEGKLEVVKVDCDIHKDLMNHYRARGLPLIVIFNGGEAIARNEGTLDYDGTVKFLDKKLPGGFK